MQPVEDQQTTFYCSYEHSGKSTHMVTERNRMNTTPVDLQVKWHQCHNYSHCNKKQKQF